MGHHASGRQDAPAPALSPVPREASRYVTGPRARSRARTAVVIWRRSLPPGMAARGADQVVLSCSLQDARDPRLALPTRGGLAARVTRIAATTRERKTAARGTSAALLGPPFRLLAPIGLLRWFFHRQRLVRTFATNLRGPAEPLTFAGTPARAVIPIPNTTGNVTVTFGVLSYAGTLRITVLSDPSQVPDVAVLTAALRGELGSAAR